MSDDLKNDEPRGHQDTVSDDAQKLAELLATMTIENMPDDLDFGSPAGKEIW